MERIVSLGKSHDEIFQGTIAKTIPYHRMYGKQYCVPLLIQFTQTEEDALKSAAEMIDRVYWKVLKFVQEYLPDDFLETQLGIHSALIPAARMEVPFHGISRQDWIVTDRGMKCIENNTDTPSGIPETAFLASEMIAQHSLLIKASSTGMRREIQTAFQNLIEHYRASGLDGVIAFTSYEFHVEDKSNTEYIRSAVAELGYDTIFVPLDELEIIPNVGLYAAGKPISILYRLYPLEYLVQDTHEATGQKVGEDLIDLLVQGKLGLINPAQSIITQSKGFMALIWSLYERRDQIEEFCGFTLLDEEDIGAIELYLLPTYYENTVFVNESTPFVSKGYWGREGKGTALFDHQGQLQEAEWGFDEEEREEVQQYYDKQPKVYQKLFPLDEVTIETEHGPYTGHLLTGVYVIGGTYSGLLPRVGGKITGDMAYYCPAAIKN